MVIEKEQLISDTVLIQCSKLKKNINGYIYHYIKDKYEGKCYENGYIIPDSLNIISRSAGKITIIDGESLIKYEITYQVKSIIPSIGDIYDCKIENITKMGIVGYLDYNSCTMENSPILFIIPNQYFGNKEFDAKDLHRTIQVKILDIRIKFMQTQIQIVAELVS